MMPRLSRTTLEGRCRGVILGSVVTLVLLFLISGAFAACVVATASHDLVGAPQFSPSVMPAAIHLGANGERGTESEPRLDPPSLRGSVDPSIPLATGSDYPTYLGNVERTSSSTSDPLVNVSTAPRLHLLWNYSADGQMVESQPVEQNGITYFGGASGYEYALYASNGTFLWKTFLGQADSDTDCPGVLGVTSSATVAGSTLYVDGGYPYLYALNSTTGAIEWQTSIGVSNALGYYDWSSPLIYNNDAYVGIASECDAPLVPAGIDEISLASHLLVGHFNTSTPESVGSSIWGSPSVNPTTNTLFFATGNPLGRSVTKYGNSILALNATTLQLQANWQVPLNEWVGDGDFGVTPTLFTPAGGTPMVTVADKNGILYAFYQSNLTLAWQQRICCQVGSHNEQVSTSFGGGYVYAVGAATVIAGVDYASTVSAFNPLSGQTVWQDTFPLTSSNGYAAPLWVNGLLIVPDQGTLLLLNASSGNVLRQIEVGGYIQAAASVSRGELFVGSTSGNVDAFDVALEASATQSAGSGAAPLTDSFAVTGSGGLPNATGSSAYGYLWDFGDGSPDSTSRSPTHTFTSPGTYTVTVAVTDLAGNVSTGSLTVGVGSGTSYPVTVRETGLPASTPWSVSIDGTTQTATAPTSCVFDIADGSYSYIIGPVSGFLPTPPSGTFTVSGAAQNVLVTFAPEYSLAFEESGLPRGFAWTVSVGAASASLVTNGGTDALVFPEANGTYAYAVSVITGWNQTTLPETGNVAVSGAAVTEPTLSYSPVVSSVTFSESGLPSGVRWNVTFNGVNMALTTSGGTATFSFASEPNGIYPYAIAVEPGYFESTVPYTGTETVNEAPIDVALTYVASTPKILIGPPQGPVGATLTVSGSAFSEMSPAIVTFDGTVITPALGADCTLVGTTLLTDAYGDFICKFTVPTEARGTYSVVADDWATSTYSAAKTFKVTVPTIVLSPTQGPVGSTFTATGSGFSASSGASVSFAGATQSPTACTLGSLAGTTITSNGAGAFDCSFAVPTVGAGSYPVVGTNLPTGALTATKSFKVTVPKITLSPTKGAVGSTFTVTGSGFSAASGVSVSFGGVVQDPSSCSVGTLEGTLITTNAAGAFACTFTVPTESPGAYSVIGTDTLTGLTSARTFTVTA